MHIVLSYETICDIRNREIYIFKYDYRKALYKFKISLQFISQSIFMSKDKYNERFNFVFYKKVSGPLLRC